MDKYNFYFESGSRSYVLHMCDAPCLSSIKVLRENTNAQDELMRIRKSCTLISYVGIRNDKDVYISKMTALGCKIDIYYEDENLNSYDKIPFEQKDSNISILESKSELSLLDSANNIDSFCKYTINVHYKNFEGNIDIVCAPARQTYEAVIDFGSEASQILIHRKDSGIHTQPIEIFKECAKDFFSIENINKNEYDQQDEDTKLFRSIFFTPVNKEKVTYSKKEAIDDIITKPSSTDRLVSFISRRDAVIKGSRIPNIKISYLTDLHPTGLNMKNLHRGIVMRFIHEVLCHIAKEEGEDSKKTVAISLTLLIPNVMCQNEVSEFISFIQESLTMKGFLAQVPQNLDIAIIEVCSCSESDASLLNWINNNKTGIELGKTYLIIDMGKGTTDFSVVKVKSGAQAEGLFRAGFVGAGNVISYAILDNCVTNMVGVVNSKRKSLIKKLLMAEPAMLYRLEQTIENIKRQYTDNKSSNQLKAEEKRIEDINNIEVETIIDRIEKGTLKADDYQIISDMINRLILIEIASRIKNLHIDHVVLSGRAFLYKPLREEIIKDLKVIFPINEIHFCSDDVKKGCLYGPLTPIKINNFSNMIGCPKSIDVRVLEKSTENVNERIEALKRNNIQRDSETKWKLVKNIVESSGKLYKFIFPEDDSVSESFDKMIKNPNTKSNMGNDKHNAYFVNETMQTGLRIKNYGKNTGFYISGSPYVLANESFLKDEKDYYIYFDGEDFYVRSDDECFLLRKDPTKSISSNLLFESLFPYSLQLLDENVDIPIAKSVRR